MRRARVIGFLEHEITRLKKGDFTPEELQNLCHNLAEDKEKKCEFFKGCCEYQKELFGSSAVDEEMERCIKMVENSLWITKAQAEKIVYTIRQR